MQLKFFIVGSQEIDKLSLARKLVEENDNLSIAETFTNNTEYKEGSNDNYIYFLESQEIDLAYKNNAILFVSTDNYVSYGITMNSFYTDDIFCMSIKDFNNISNVVFESKLYDIIVIWVDSKIKEFNKETREDIYESKYLMSRLDNLKYMYFFEENINTISDIILDYINSDEQKRQELIENNQ